MTKSSGDCSAARARACDESGSQTTEHVGVQNTKSRAVECEESSHHETVSVKFPDAMVYVPADENVCDAFNALNP